MILPVSKSQMSTHDVDDSSSDFQLRKVRTLKQHPRKNKVTINIEYMQARYKGLQKNDNQLAMLFTLANLFRIEQMIRQRESSH